MTTAIVEETSTLSGEINAPPSKSYTHRAIISSALTQGVSHIRSPLISQDTQATIDACHSLGASIRLCDTELQITGASKFSVPQTPINCRDSASTIRFLTPIAALVEGKTVLDGSAGLRKRPLAPLLDALRKLGVSSLSTHGFPPVTIVGGHFIGGRTSMVGDVSSQFITGLLFACPLALNDTEVFLTTPLESKPYVHLTLNILSSHGIRIDTSENLQTFHIPCGQRYVPHNHFVPGDFSGAAFLLAASAMTNSDVKVNNLYVNQPDSEIIVILRKMGASVTFLKDSVQVSSNKLNGIAIDVSDIPDLVPVCTAMACISEGQTRIYRAKRLRFKESDRLSVLSTELQKMGANISEEAEGLIINGSPALHSATINPHGDHRIAMACTIAGLKARGTTEILEAECVQKSYPNFFTDLSKLGAKIHVQ